MLTCWISLHETTADAGPIEYVRGSHLWPKSPPERSQFHAPEDWLAPARNAAPEGEPSSTSCRSSSSRAEARSTTASPGTARRRTRTPRVARMALVTHMLPVEVRFHETNVDLIYSRYRRQGDLSLDESFFPVLWDESGYRTPWLAVAARTELGARRAAAGRLAARERLKPRPGARLRRALTRSRGTAPPGSRAARSRPADRRRSPSSSSARVTTTHVVSVSAVIVAIRPAPGSSTSISPISAPAPSVSAPAGPLDAHATRRHEHQRVGDLAALHQRLAGREAHLVAAQQELVEQLLRQPREELGVAEHALVAAAVEEQRLALAVAGVLDVAEEERVVAAPVRAHDARDEMRERALDERRVAHDDELRLDALRRRGRRTSRRAPSGPARGR